MQITVSQASTDELLNGVRALLAPIWRDHQELSALDIHRIVFDSREKFRGIGFRYGSPVPYSERLEDVISILLATGELEISRRNPCKLVVTDTLKTND
jgi:hypothetical protein